MMMVNHASGIPFQQEKQVAIHVTFGILPHLFRLSRQLMLFKLGKHPTPHTPVRKETWRNPGIFFVLGTYQLMGLGCWWFGARWFGIRIESGALK